MTDKFPIEVLVDERCRKLGIDYAEIVQRAGYKKIQKGLRRLAKLRAGEWQAASRGLIDKLPEALEVPAEIVRLAIAETDRQICAAADAAWRAAFRPHAIILTEHTRPTSIIMAAFTGGTRRLRIGFDEASTPIEYIRLALEEIPRRTAERGGEITFFGRPTGVVVNYSPDHAIRFDLEGNALELLHEAYRPGELTVRISGRPTSPGELDAILGTSHHIVERWSPAI